MAKAVSLAGLTDLPFFYSLKAKSGRASDFELLDGSFEPLADT